MVLNAGLREFKTAARPSRQPSGEPLRRSTATNDQHVGFDLMILSSVNGLTDLILKAALPNAKDESRPWLARLVPPGARGVTSQGRDFNDMKPTGGTKGAACRPMNKTNVTKDSAERALVVGSYHRAAAIVNLVNQSGRAVVEILKLLDPAVQTVVSIDTAASKIRLLPIDLPGHNGA